MSAEVKVVTLIRTELETRGKGTPEDPVRRIVQLWTLAGELYAELDPHVRPCPLGAACPRSEGP